MKLFNLIKRISWSNLIMWPMIIITVITPRNVNLIPVPLYTSFKADHIYDEFVDDDGELQQAKDYVIKKVETSEHIKNKEEIIDRIKNVNVSTHEEDTDLLMFLISGYNMVYLHNWYYDADYVVVRGDDNGRLYEFVHELNHLVDEHQRPIPRFKYDDLIDMSNNNEGVYKQYYSNWGYHRNIGPKNFRYLDRMENYLTSSEEVYARISTLKYRLVQIGIMDIDETLREEHVNEFRDIIKEALDMDLYRYLINTNGFMTLLPLINWERVDILETI